MKYQPIVYLWLEVPGKATKGQFRLALALGAEIRHGKQAKVRCHIWMSDTKVINYSELLPRDLSELYGPAKKHADEIRARITLNAKTQLPPG